MTIKYATFLGLSLVKSFVSDGNIYHIAYFRSFITYVKFSMAQGLLLHLIVSFGGIDPAELYLFILLFLFAIDQFPIEKLLFGPNAGESGSQQLSYFLQCGIHPL